MTDNRFTIVRDALLEAAIRLAEARAAFEAAKSDPARNVVLGQALYAAEQNFQKASSDYLKP